MEMRLPVDVLECEGGGCPSLEILVQMRLCQCVPVDVPESERVRLSFFGNLSEDEAVPVDVPKFRVMMVFFRYLREDKAIPVDVTEREDVL